MPELSSAPRPTFRVKPKQFTSHLIKHEVLATQFNYFEFETTEPFDFDAGQYVNAIVAEHTFRAYSIASKVSENVFGLLIDTRPGGPGSQFFSKIKVGDEMKFLGPLGVFIIRDDGADNILLLGTGSGMSPLRCIVEDELLVKKTTKPIYLYMGLTHSEEIFWKDYFEKFANDYPNFKFRLAILEPDETWDGYKGYNTELMKQDFPDASSCSAYLCGHPAMIKGATQILLDSKCPKAHVYEEKFFAQ